MLSLPAWLNPWRHLREARQEIEMLNRERDALMSLLHSEGVPACVDPGWVTYDVEEGFDWISWGEDPEEALSDLVEHHRDAQNWGSEGWHEGVESIALYKLVPVAWCVLDTKATAGGGTEIGETCRERGWDYANLRVVRHPAAHIFKEGV